MGLLVVEPAAGVQRGGSVEMPPLASVAPGPGLAELAPVVRSQKGVHWVHLVEADAAAGALVFFQAGFVSALGPCSGSL